MEKRKKRTINERYDFDEKWVLADAIKALEVEQKYSIDKLKTLVIKFPDPVISRSSIHDFSDAIVNVHVNSPLSPRLCFVTLKQGTDVQQVIDKINKTPFGNGFLRAELKMSSDVSFFNFVTPKNMLFFNC